MSPLGKRLLIPAVAAMLAGSAEDARAQLPEPTSTATVAPAGVPLPPGAALVPVSVEPIGFGQRSAPGCLPGNCYPVPNCPTPYYGYPGMPPSTPNPMMPPGTPDPLATLPTSAPDFGALGSGAGVGPTVGLGGYVENALPITTVRIRFDAAYDNNRPDRGEFFYAKCGCFRTPDAHGVPLPEKNIDYQELSAYGEYAFTERFSVFGNLPIRFLNPDVNANASGLSDVSFGAKYAFIYNDRRVVSFRLNFQAPSGSISTGLGTGNWWVEPGILFTERLSQDWQLFGELRYQAPLAPRSDFTGNMFRYGLGTSYVVARGRWGYVAPVAELVGWTVLDGKQLNPDTLTAQSARGDTIVNAKLGVRIGLGAPSNNSYAPTRSDLYVGYGRSLTGEVWYKNMFRVEYRYLF